MADDADAAGGQPLKRAAGLESTFELVERAKRGDQEAIERLFARLLTPLQRWASGRLPKWARDLADTDDLVQESLLQTFKRIGEFEPRRVGALQAYLRQAVLETFGQPTSRATQVFGSGGPRAVQLGVRVNF